MNAQTGCKQCTQKESEGGHSRAFPVPQEDRGTAVHSAVKGQVVLD